MRITVTHIKHKQSRSWMVWPQVLGHDALLVHYGSSWFILLEMWTAHSSQVTKFTKL